MNFLCSPGRVGRQGGVQLFALSTVCGLLYGLAQDARIALDAARQAQAAPTANATQYVSFVYVCLAGPWSYARWPNYAFDENMQATG